MNKYSAMSDFEINLRIAQLIFSDEEYGIIKNTMDIVYFLVDGSFGYRFFDPCNNPSDAMPIIIENKICLTVGDSDDIWVADTTRSLESSFNASPLRAAMELFLLMKDAENEG